MRSVFGGEASSWAVASAAAASDRCTPLSWRKHESAVQRFGRHRRADRAIRPITRQTASVAAANGLQKPIDAGPRLIGNVDAGSLAHW